MTKVRLDPPRLILMNYIDGYALRRLAVAVWRRFKSARSCGAPESERNDNYHHGARTKATIELWRFIKSLS